jgi:hypothetical protein
MTCPADARPRSPKPSGMAERPAITELNLIASSTGMVSTPVVTLPAS